MWGVSNFDGINDYHPVKVTGYIWWCILKIFLLSKRKNKDNFFIVKKSKGCVGGGGVSPRSGVFFM